MNDARPVSELLSLKALFGSPARVHLCVWILLRGDEPFFQTEAQDAMRHHSHAPSVVAGQLDVLVQEDMLMRVASERRVYFTAVESRFWQVFVALNSAMRDDANNGSSGVLTAR